MDAPETARAPMPEHLLPMLATPGSLPREPQEWGFEVKWDGIRALTYWRPGRMRIESRNLNDVTSRYPELRALGEELGMREAVLDGEIVAFDEHGRLSFERLQKRMHLGSESAIRRLAHTAPVSYMIFDVLFLDGELLTSRSYEQRRVLLAELRLEGATWHTPAYHVSEGRELLAATAELGLEGVIAKRMSSPYRAGARSPDWLKLKNLASQELVVGGWLPGKRGRAGRLGALLVGYYGDPADPGSLRYAGRVGTGFDDAELARLSNELAKRSRRTSPFAKSGPKPPREARFVEPELVAEVQFSEWTRDGVMRAPSYKGLRTDKPARQVVLEPSGLKTQRQTRGSVEGAPAQRQNESEKTGSGRDHPEPPYVLLRETARQAEIQVQGRQLKLSNREKVLFPRTGFTKGDLVEYYAAVAPVVLPHLAGRPLTLKRYPDGVEGQYFYEKRCPPSRPHWVRTAPVWSEQAKAPIDYCLVEDLPTLVWLANLADIELHTSLSRARDMDTPTTVVFDLDPGAPAALRECCRVALLIRELLAALDLQMLVKTSGSKGLQAYVPLNSEVSYEHTKPFAQAVAQLLEKRYPKLVVSRMAKSERTGKVLIDWSQNDPHKTTVCVYSVRARERPTVSMPLAWEEVERGARRRKEFDLSLEPAALLARVQDRGDLFAGALTLVQKVPSELSAASTGSSA
jgi:bifunctional non-homologous end joining protein LigD